MKLSKLLSLILVICFAALIFAGCSTVGTTAATADGTAATGAGQYTSLIMIVAVFAVFYFLMIRPEKKRKKKAEEMRSSVEVGDKIITIGGMVGRVVRVADDRLTYETGEDRVRIEIMKWAISSNEGRGANKESSDSEEKIET